MSIHDTDMEASSSSSLQWTLRHFSVDSYTQGLTGHAKISRLVHIARIVPRLSPGNECIEEKEQIRQKALNLAMEHLKEGGGNTELYRKLCEEAGQTPDEDWIAQENQRLQQKQATLGRQVNSAMADQSREDIRTSLGALGKLCESCGDLESAIKNYSRATEYCTRSFMGQMYLNIAHAAFQANQWDVVIDYVNKALRLKDSTEDTKVNSVCQALLGLGYIMKNRGDEAITELCKLGLEQEEEISRIICIPEVARLVIVAALAHRPRNFLEEQLLKGKRLQRIVETAPKLKQIVRYFLDAEYGEALKCWKELEPSLFLDSFLHKHVNRYSTLFLERCICEYLSPFETVVLRRMSADLNISERELKRHVANLIISGKTAVKIDEEGGRLLKTKLSGQETCWEEAARTAEDFNLKAHETIFTLNLKRRGFFEKSHKIGMMEHDIADMY